MNKKISHYFHVHKLVHNKQYGFTKDRSTIDASAALLKHILKAWELSKNVLVVFCDLSKAFDCVNHQTLISKLECYGIQNTTLKLLNSHLSARAQTVDINGVKSSGSHVKMGVPQVSVLGPFIF